MSAHEDVIGRTWLHRLVWRAVCWWEWRPVEPPRELLDPDGEGVYVLGDDGPPWPSTLHYGASLLGFYNWGNYRHIDFEHVWMEPDADGELWHRSTRSVNVFSWLPHRYRPVEYVYCTPRPAAQEGARR